MAGFVVADVAGHIEDREPDRFALLGLAQVERAGHFQLAGDRAPGPDHLPAHAFDRLDCDRGGGPGQVEDRKGFGTPAPAWEGSGSVLADTSAWMQARRDPNARDLLLGAVERGLEGLCEAPVDRAVQRVVLATMRELAATGSHGAHRFPLIDFTT